jgi:hypothetical protein
MFTRRRPWLKMQSVALLTLGLGGALWVHLVQLPMGSWTHADND